MWLSLKGFVFLCFCASYLSDSRRIITVNRKKFMEKSGQKNTVTPHRLQNSTNSDVLGNSVFEIRRNSQSHAIDTAGSVSHPPSHNLHPTRKKKAKPKTTVKKIAWHHCADESKPKQVDRSSSDKGVMCSREYPTFTCCGDHDLTVDLLGSKVSRFTSESRLYLGGRYGEVS